MHLVRRRMHENTLFDFIIFGNAWVLISIEIPLEFSVTLICTFYSQHLNVFFLHLDTIRCTETILMMCLMESSESNKHMYPATYCNRITKNRFKKGSIFTALVQMFYSFGLTSTLYFGELARNIQQSPQNRCFKITDDLFLAQPYLNLAVLISDGVLFHHDLLLQNEFFPTRQQK